MGVVINQFQIYLVNLDPTQGAEIKKTRPCVIVSPNELNQHIKTVIVAPMTTKTRKYPTRVSVVLQDKKGQIALDQIRTIDKSRLVKCMGEVPAKASKQVLNVLQEMFA